jgi:hypothetical protein
MPTFHTQFVAQQTETVTYKTCALHNLHSFYLESLRKWANDTYFQVDVLRFIHRVQNI